MIMTNEERMKKIEMAIDKMILTQDLLMSLPPKPWTGFNAKSYENREAKLNSDLRHYQNTIKVQTRLIAKSYRED